MSDTLADLTSLLPSEFFSGDIYHHKSPSSTESDTDDDDNNFPELTRRFTRSVSLQDRLKSTPYPLENKMFFSGSPESTLNWNVTKPTHVRSTQTTPFLRPEEDTWDLFYQLQLARKMKNINDVVFANTGPTGPPRHPRAPLCNHTQNCGHYSEQQFRKPVSGNYNGGGRFVGGKPAGFGQSSWPPQPVQPVFGGLSRTNSFVKKGCAGTGVFLPRNYTNIQPDTIKPPVCTAAHLPTRVAESYNKNMDHVVTKPQPNMNGAFPRQYQVQPSLHNGVNCEDLAEWIIGQRQNAVMLAQAQQRRGNGNAFEAVPETRMGQKEVVLPQEWTY